MDRKYIIDTAVDRIALLKKRYRNYCECKDDIGAELSYGSAAVGRTNTLKELNMLKLIMELTSYIQHKEFNLSEDAENGLDKILAPMERHRRLVT